MGSLMVGHIPHCWKAIQVTWNYAFSGHMSFSTNASCVPFIEEIWTHTGVLHFRFSTNAIK